MNSANRLISEYLALYRLLAPRDFLTLLSKTVGKSGNILRSKKLTSLDLAMSRKLTIRFRDRKVHLPLDEIDRLLAGQNDNPTFGNVREIFARDCYLTRANIAAPIANVLDLGANRGLFSILALAALGARLVVGVEPVSQYEPVFALLLKANGFDAANVFRYKRFIASPSLERRDPIQNVSVETILRERKVDRFDLVKIDIEGAEKDLFREPQWLARVDTIVMELHPGKAGDLSEIPAALKRHGFDFVATDQWNRPSQINEAMFLFASRPAVSLERSA